MCTLAAESRKPLSSWSLSLCALGVMRENEPMSRHTTLGVGGVARWFFRPTCRSSLQQAMRMIPEDVEILPLGRGSNLLVADAGFHGLVIDLAELNALQLSGCEVRAEAGVRMSRMARHCAEHGLSGCEFMATVPGDIGGGVAMNAGCFSQQLSDTLVSVKVLLRDGSIQQCSASSLKFSYRYAQLPCQSLVVEACFQLKPGHPDNIREQMRGMRSRRSSTQPLSQPNCGSVFKNPDGKYAAQLIEAVGLKGLKIGGASISKQHANFIVNEGEASSADVVALIRRAQQQVATAFDVMLEPEVRMVGEW